MADLNFATVVREAVTLLQSKDIDAAIASFKADTPEKEISLEYVTSYLQFVREVAERDAAKARLRADYEIRELLGHVNAMLKEKQPDLFMKMLLNVPRHYKTLFDKLLKSGAASK
ncbi:MAG TPA: hypothetical protein PKK43_04890 [Spirochaetota bacterium]|nr:hypothetical protein [Spirochaetota bacterium]